MRKPHSVCDNRSERGKVNESGNGLTSALIALFANAKWKGLGAHLTLHRAGHMLGHKEVIVEHMQLGAFAPAIFPFVCLRVGHDVVSGWRQKRRGHNQSVRTTISYRRNNTFSRRLRYTPRQALNFRRRSSRLMQDSGSSPAFCLCQK